MGGRLKSCIIRTPSNKVKAVVSPCAGSPNLKPAAIHRSLSRTLIRQPSFWWDLKAPTNRSTSNRRKTIVARTHPVRRVKVKVFTILHKFHCPPKQLCLGVARILGMPTIMFGAVLSNINNMHPSIITIRTGSSSSSLMSSTFHTQLSRNSHTLACICLPKSHHTNIQWVILWYAIISISLNPSRYSNKESSRIVAKRKNSIEVKRKTSFARNRPSRVYLSKSVKAVFLTSQTDKRTPLNSTVDPRVSPCQISCLLASKLIASHKIP